MTIREAAPEDAAAISEVAMRAKAHWGYDQEFLHACHPELTWTAEEIERDDVLVWDEEGTVAGVTTRTGEVPDGSLRAVFVDPALHGRGVGRALVIGQVPSDTRPGRVLPLLRFHLSGGAR